MNPYEHLLQELGNLMETSFRPDQHQSCLITFPQDNLAIQIDLDSHGDRIIVGTQLAQLVPGPYRDRIFEQALIANGTGLAPRGTLAYSPKNDTLVLFSFLFLLQLTGEKLYEFLQVFNAHAKLWKQALNSGDIPTIPTDQIKPQGARMYGLY